MVPVKVRHVLDCFERCAKSVNKKDCGKACTTCLLRRMWCSGCSALERDQLEQSSLYHL